MTIEELLAKKLSQEIDIEILTGLLKGVDTPDEEIKGHVDTLRRNLNNELERDLLGGIKKIHKTE